jgi:hypothetical protein
MLYGTHTFDVSQLFEGSQSRQKIKYGHESSGIRNQELLCWRGPAERYFNLAPYLIIYSAKNYIGIPQIN